MDTIFFFFFTLSLLFVINLLISSRKTRNKNLPPSPPSLPIVGHLHLLSKPLHRSLATLSSTHGPLLLLRFGSRQVLLVSSLSLAQDCFTNNDLAFATRPQLPSAKRLSYNYTTLATAPYGPHWRNLRRIAAIHIFSSSRMHAFADARVDEVLSMVGQLFHDTIGSLGCWKKVKLRPRLFGVSLNVIMRMIAGKRYYGELYGEDAVDAKETREFREMLEESLGVIGVSNIGDFLPLFRMVDFGGVNKKLARVAEKTNRMLQGLIDEYRRKSSRDLGRDGEGKSTKTMIGELIAMQEESPEYYTDQNIKALIVTLLFAGSDTSTETIDWVMSLLLNHPNVLQKARLEIDTYMAKKERFIEEDDLHKLPYLQAIINETLRLYPTAPLLVPHESLEDTIVGCHDVPRGTMILTNAWAIHRDPKIWPEPNSFMPERFLDDTEGGGDVKILPFGLGRRRCPGEGLAMRVIGLVLGTLLQCFEWERVGDDMVDMTEGVGILLSKANPVEAMYRPREHMIHHLSLL